MGKLKSLASDTIIYGASTILGRLLNWLLMPLYIRTIAKAEYGIVTDIYCIIAVALVVACLGFETGYFRFVNEENKNRLMDTLLSAVSVIGILIISSFVLFDDFLCYIIHTDISRSSSLFIASLIVVADALNSVFFAELRYYRRSVLYSILRLFQVIITVLFVLFFIFFLRNKTFFDFDFSSISDVNYILIANLIGSLSSIIYFMPSFFTRKHQFDYQILKTVSLYCIPLVGMGFFGNLNQQIEKLMLPHLVNSVDDSQVELAIYAANFKIGVLMAIFTQSFRLAFEPFFFKESSSNDKRDIYADVMKYFVYFGLIIYACVILFVPLVNQFILKPDYVRGNVIIPYVLIGQLFFGVYYSLSMWYKKIDKTYFGIIMSTVGLVVNIILNIVLVPQYGIIGAAISSLCGYFVMMMLSLILGNHYYPIPYQFTRMTIVSVLVIAFVCFVQWISESYIPRFWFIPSSLAILFIIFALLKIEGISILKILNRGKGKN